MALVTAKTNKQHGLFWRGGHLFEGSLTVGVDTKGVSGFARIRATLRPMDSLIAPVRRPSGNSCPVGGPMATTVFGLQVQSDPVTFQHWAPKMIEQCEMNLARLQCYTSRQVVYSRCLQGFLHPRCLALGFLPSTVSWKPSGLYLDTQKP